MDKIINFLLLIICIVIFFILLFNKEDIERFGFSDNDKDYYHDFNLSQRKIHDLFIEDNNLILNSPKLNNPLRDVDELINYSCDETNIYDLTRVKNNKKFTNNLDFW
jgi:hypothetical protein